MVLMDPSVEGGQRLSRREQGTSSRDPKRYVDRRTNSVCVRISRNGLFFCIQRTQFSKMFQRFLKLFFCDETLRARVGR